MAYMARHVENVVGQVKWFGIVNSASMITAALLLPILGVICDRTGRSKQYLVWTTLICVTLTACFSLASHAVLLLLLFFLANVTYQTSLLFYNDLLPGLIRREREGLLSGLGIGLAYIGTIGATLLSLFVLGAENDPLRFRWTFLLAAGVFLVFAIPTMLWVPGRQAKPQVAAGDTISEFRKLATLIRELPAHRPLFLFLLGNFLLTDVLNTSIQAFVPYIENVFRVDNQTIMLRVVIPLNIAAFISGILMGYLSDRYKAKYPMMVAAALLGLTLLTAGVLAEERYFPIVNAVVVLCGGLGLAGIWAAGRKCLLDLAPPDQVGAYFSLYVISQKVSVIGSLTFFTLADVFSYRVAILSQVALLLPGLILIFIFRYPERNYETAE